LYGYPERYQEAKPEVINVKKEWKPKEGSSALITNVTPIATVPEIAAKKNNKTSTVKKGTSMSVSDSPSASINVNFGTVGNNDSPIVVKKSHTITNQNLDPINPKTVEPNVDTYQKGFVATNVETSGKFVDETRPLVKPRFDKTLGQPSLNVATECAIMSPTKVVDTVIGSLKETLHESNVVPDVSTSVALPWLISDLLLLF
jgi:hypothetical protein